MKESLLQQKSLDFALRIVSLYKFMTEDKHENIISKQVLRSGTSIGANVNESYYAQSKPDFITKLHISLKECAETHYWLKLIVNANYINQDLGESLINDCVELKKILTASINTAKKEIDK